MFNVYVYIEVYVCVQDIRLETASLLVYVYNDTEAVTEIGRLIGKEVKLSR